MLSNNSLFRFVFVLLLVSVTATPITQNDSLLVTLDYGTFQGAQSAAYNLTYFRRIPFGASTAGTNRFRAPQPPASINGTYSTDRAFDMCPQRTVNGSEDCLYLGLYSRPWTPSQPLRPVLLTFYGGGFIQGSASFTIPPSGFPVLNVSTTNDYVVVYSNYRTNVFGLLPGKKIQEAKTTDLNPGLLDQQAALVWIQKHIEKFGGDKTNVTIWGQSAGGGSVVAQSIATGNKGKGLFSKALASSPYWPKTYRYDSPEAEELYEEVVQGTGCKGKPDEVGCLQSVDVQTLRDVSLRLSTSHTYNSSSYTWSPVIDDAFLTEPLSEVVRKKTLNADMVLSSYNLHEGENFIPPGLQSAAGSAGFNSSSASFDAWLKGFLPGFGEKEIEQAKELYPQDGSTEELTWNSTYTRAGVLYRDLILACPAYWLANSASKGSLIEYTISPAKHASDTIYWNQVNAVQNSDPLTYHGYTGALASFIETGDPNAHKITNATVGSVPRIDSGKQFLVNAGGLTTGTVDMLKKRCDFWLSQAGKVPV
ncbi:alpha/beta-hydrolase [Lophiostoma macrostomum CBS 122681]|uniref:Carboxylic ester hydrolase n=1 Tax=Lophiostoma macrostomum CBS 122681 TaxID=1314788 RepID=A0A6A6T6K4_9PLEO|nr:alpha/beta-hydrolase [Lophiostoma macrostomum CBS 122681]